MDSKKKMTILEALKSGQPRLWNGPKRDEVMKHDSGSSSGATTDAMDISSGSLEYWKHYLDTGSDEFWPQDGSPRSFSTMVPGVRMHGNAQPLGRC